MRQILVVEDNEVMMVSMARTLEKAGYNVTTTADPRNALELVQTSYFDLVITDLLMPFLSGLDVLKFIKSFTPERKVLMFSSKSDERTKMDCYHAGAEDYINKQTSLAELAIRVKRLIG